MVIRRFTEALTGRGREAGKPSEEEAPKPKETDVAALEETADYVAKRIRPHRQSGGISPKELTAAKREYLQDHPDQQEIAELLFSLPLHLQRSGSRAPSRARHPHGIDATRAFFEELTSYNIAVTRHLVRYAGRRKYLREFWRNLKIVAHTCPAEDREKLNHCRTGWLAEAAAYHILSQLGENPEHGTPGDDAFGRADLYWKVPGQEAPVAVQVKTRKDVKEATIAAEYNISPSAITREDVTRIHAPRRGLLRKPDDKPFVARIVVHLPHGGFSWISGYPTKDTLDECRKQYEAILEELKELRG